MGALQRRLAEQDPVVGDDADRDAIDVGEAGDQRLAVQRLELVEAAGVDEPGDDLADRDRTARIGGDGAVDPGRIDRGKFRRATVPGLGRRLAVEVGDDRTTEGQGVFVIERFVVGNAGLAGVDVGATELLGGDVLPGGGLHERWSAEEDRAGALDDDGLVAHGRDVRAAGRAAAHHERDLGDGRRRHAGLVVEDPPEVVAVRKDVGLEREEGAAAVDEIDARQPILECDLLGTEVLLHGHRVVRAALDGRVVGDDDAGRALDPADAGDDAGTGRVVVVQAGRGERAELEEGTGGIEQAIDPLADGQLAALTMPLDRAVVTPGAAVGEVGLAISQVVDQGGHRVVVRARVRCVGVEPAAQDRHSPMIGGMTRTGGWEPRGQVARRATMRMLLAILICLAAVPAACSPAAIASLLPSAGPLVTVSTRGGMCPDGPCGTTVTLHRDGTVHEATLPPNEIAGTVPAPQVAAIDAAIQATDFATLRSRPFTGECPTAFDGQEILFAFTTPTGTEHISTCEVDVDLGAPVFVAVGAALGPFIALPLT